MNLKNHVIGKFFKMRRDEYRFSDETRGGVQVENNTLYQHQTLRLNYMTYDLRREQDLVSLNGDRNVLTLSNETDDDGFPYWVGRVYGIFHANVRIVGSVRNAVAPWWRINFLLVRWFGRVTDHMFGLRHKRLPLMAFMDTVGDVAERGAAFGFLSPDHLLRTCHMIPRFKTGITKQLLPLSIARREDDDDTDYAEYFLSIVCYYYTRVKYMFIVSECIVPLCKKYCLICILGINVISTIVTAIIPTKVGLRCYFSISI